MLVSDALSIHLLFWVQTVSEAIIGSRLNFDELHVIIFAGRNGIGFNRFIFYSRNNGNVVGR